MELARKPSDPGKDTVGALVFELDTILSRLSKYTLSVKLAVALLAISRRDLGRFSFVFSFGSIFTKTSTSAESHN